MSDQSPQGGPDPSPPEAGDVDHLVIYGDFSCPFSELAHRRATRRAEPFEWRAIEHAPEVPADGEPIDDEARAGFEAELSQIRELLTDGEADDQRVPTRRINTARLNARYASLPASRRDEFARAVFDACWRDGRDLDDATELERFDAPSTADGEDLAREWQRQWEGFERRIVPMMQLPGGKLSRGLGALMRLQ